LGAYLYDLYGIKNESEEERELSKKKWKAVGQTIVGVITAFISQPFDVLARRFQKSVSLPGEKLTRPNWLEALRIIHSEWVAEGYPLLRHPLFFGALPRMALATYGGVLANFFYTEYKSMGETSYHSTTE